MRDDDPQGRVCVVSGDATTYATSYGGVVSVSASEAATRIELQEASAVELGLATVVLISYDPGIVDVDYLQQQIDLTLG